MDIIINNIKNLNMKTLVIINSKSIESILCKHIVLALLSNPTEHTFHDTEKSTKYYLPTEDQTTNFNKIIFIGTYPRLAWYNQYVGSKSINVYADYENNLFTFNAEINSYLYLIDRDGYTKETIPHKFLLNNYSEIEQNLINSTNDLYVSRSTIFKKLSDAIGLFCRNNYSYKSLLLLSGLSNDSAIKQLIMTSNLLLLSKLTENILIENNAKIKIEEFVSNSDFTYLSTICDNVILQDKLFKITNHDLIDINLVKFIEYREYVGINKIKLTFVPTNEDMLFEPNYNALFGSTTNSQHIINYIIANYDVNFNDWGNVDHSMNITNHYLTDNYNNSISIIVPINTLLAVKDSEIINN